MSLVEILELKKKSGMLLVGVMFGMVILMVLPFAAAQPILVTLVQSDTCKLSKTCIKMADLITFDNSDQRISGKLVSSPSGDYSRTKPQFKNHWAFYQYSKESFIVCVDCDLSFQAHSKVITIESSSSFKYVKQSDHIIVNNTFHEYNNRFLDGCSAATVSSDILLINDTISYFSHNCKVPSKYDDHSITVKPKTKMTDCSYACMNAKFMKEAKEKSKKTFLSKPDIILKKQNDKVKLNG